MERELWKGKETIADAKEPIEGQITPRSSTHSVISLLGVCEPQLPQLQLKSSQVIICQISPPRQNTIESL